MPSSALSDVSIAVVHVNYDDGGGERVADALARCLDAPLYVGFQYGGSPPSDIDARQLDTPSLAGKSTFVRDAWTVLGLAHLPELHEYDVIVQSGNESAWYVPPDDQVVIRYAHSTPRTPYDRFPQKGSSAVYRAYSFAVRSLYGSTVPYPDLYMANSSVVARRLRRYTGVPEDEIRVVHPPVEIPEELPEPPEDYDEYWFTWSRLAENKEYGEVIEAFSVSDEQLVLAGDGEQRDHLEERARGHDNIDLVGYVDEERKQRLAAGAKGVLFNARNEDFGIVPIEAMGCGTPVVGVDEGFTSYQIKTGKNGALYDRGVPNLSSAMFNLVHHGVEWSPSEIRQFALQFAPSVFRESVRECVQLAIARAEVEPRVEYDPAEVVS